MPGSAHAAGFADSSFAQASSLIFVSELGDKTFFIAALLAARAKSAQLVHTRVLPPRLHGPAAAWLLLLCKVAGA